jgi:uncharacterized protein YecT (DUF1311 family)
LRRFSENLTMLEKIGTRPELPGRELRSRSGAVKLTGWIMIEAWLGAAVPAAAANWADDKSFSNSEYAQSKAICRSLKGLSLPAADGPDRAAAEALKGCSSEKLYYGIGMPPDPERARQCAYLERTARDGGGFSGDTMLMTIYANGVGAERNLDLAITFACQLDGAPAEEDGRVKHLATLKARYWAGHDFSFCDDITSGFAQGLCVGHDAGLADAERQRQFATLTDSWSEGEKRAFAALQQAESGFVKARAGNEVDLRGTARRAFVVDEEQTQQQNFLAMLQSLAAGTAPTFTSEQFAAADARLNAVYQKVQQAPAKDWGTVTKDGIRTVQRAWLIYRDAWVAFAKIKYPSISTDSIRTWLTQKRSAELEAFLS